MKVTWVPEHTGFNTIFHQHTVTFVCFFTFLKCGYQKYLNDPYALHHIFIGQYRSKVLALLVTHWPLLCTQVLQRTGQADQTLPVCVCVSHSVLSDSLGPRGLWPTRLLCPWDSPGKNTGVGGHSLLQGIFPTQGLNPDLLRCRQTLYCLSHQGSPKPCIRTP